MEASSLPVNFPSIDEEEKAQSHSTVSTPDKPITSLNGSVGSASDKSEETQKNPQGITKTKSTQRRGRDQRAKKAFKEA